MEFGPNGGSGNSTPIIITYSVSAAHPFDMDQTCLNGGTRDQLKANLDAAHRLIFSNLFKYPPWPIFYITEIEIERFNILYMLLAKYKMQAFYRMPGVFGRSMK